MKQRIIILLNVSILILSLMLILPLAVMGAGGSTTQTTYTDFSQSCSVLTGIVPVPILTNTYVSDVAGGAVILAATLKDDFGGSTLDPRWETGIWGSGHTYTPTVSGGILTLPGAGAPDEGGWVRSTGTYTHGVIETVAEFGPDKHQHIGFAPGDGLISGRRYFIFSTKETTDTLFARVSNDIVPNDISVNLGPLPTGLHRYRIEWKAVDDNTDHVSFLLDGVSQAEFDVASDGVTGEARDFYAYLSNNGMADLRIDYVQIEPPYVTNGTYTGCAFDAGAGNGWQTINWDAVLTSSTGLTAEARVSADGSTWSDWTSVSDGGLINSNTLTRYAQYRLFLSTGDNQLTSQVDAVTLISDTLPSLSINNATVSEGNAGTVNAIFTVTLSATSTHTTTINYATANSTAVAPADYLTATGVLTFPPNVITRTITVTVQSDLLDEDNEKFLINLSNPINATLGDGQGEGTINNDDAPPTASINDASVTEGNSGTTNALFTISLSQSSGKVINVSYVTADGSAVASSDYVTASGTLTFTPGITSRQVTVAVNGDGVVEPNESFLVNLTNLVNVTPNDPQGIGTITNDDILGVTVTEAGGSTNVVEAGTTDTYQLKLTSQPTATVTISLSPDSQISVNPISANFTPLNWNAAQTITVTAVDDAVVEGAHSGVISHTAISTDTAYNNISIGSIIVNITDNDAASQDVFLPVIIK